MGNRFRNNFHRSGKRPRLCTHYGAWTGLRTNRAGKRKNMYLIWIAPNCHRAAEKASEIYTDDTVHHSCSLADRDCWSNGLVVMLRACRFVVWNYEWPWICKPAGRIASYWKHQDCSRRTSNRSLPKMSWPIWFEKAIRAVALNPLCVKFELIAESVFSCNYPAFEKNISSLKV